MKRFNALLLCLVCSITLFAQEKLYIHKKDRITLGAPVSMTDSVYFNTNGTTAYFRIGGKLMQFNVSDIDSLSFGASSDIISVSYNGSEVTVLNALAF